jgi:hypothetical protein
MTPLLQEMTARAVLAHRMARSERARAARLQEGRGLPGWRSWRRAAGQSLVALGWRMAGAPQPIPSVERSV